MKQIPAKKRLGQHFLADARAARQIVEATGAGPEDLVVEIGPGRGALTGLLLERARRVVGIELDEDLSRRLAARDGNLTLVNRDVLRVDLADLVRREGFARAVLVGNLPYRITGALVRQILDARAVWTRAVVMVQREVARRMVASPGGKEYGVLSIAVQLRTSPEVLLDLPPDRFVPAPRVHSSVVRLDFSLLPTVQVEDERFFFQVVRTAFGQRRKMLRNTLSSLVGGQEDVLERALSQAGVDSRLRPEAVSIAQFEQICRGLRSLVPEPAGKGGGLDAV